MLYQANKQTHYFNPHVKMSILSIMSIDITKELDRRRDVWVKKFLGKDDYEFGDITKKAITNFTGKDEYEFGDISKKLMNNLFGKRKRGNKRDTTDNNDGAQ